MDSPLVPSLNRVKSLVDGDYIAYFPSLTPVCGSHKAAAMLSVALGWTRSWLRQHPEREGWFWKTREEWRLETGLSRREQETARKALLEAGIFEERLRGMPARMHFRIDLERLGGLLARSGQETFTRWDWDDPLVRRLLGRPVALYRRFALAAGSLAGGLLLSHLMLAYRKHIASAGEDWAWLQMNTTLLGRHCRLTRHEIDGARRRLADLGFVRTRYTQTLPTRRVVRVEFDRLIQAIEACGSRQSAQSVSAPHEYNSLAFSDRQILYKPPNKPVANRHPEFPKTYQLDSRKAPNRVSANVPTSRALSGNSPTGANPHPDWVCGPPSRAGGLPHDKKPLTPPPAPAPNEPSPVWPEADCGGGEEKLVFSGSLLLAEQREARRWLGEVRPELRQLVLDEHAGQLRGLKEVRNPLGLLRYLIRAAQEGRFTPTIAYRVAEARERAREAVLRQRQAREEARITQSPEARRRLSAEHVALMRALLGAGTLAGRGGGA